MEVISIFSEHLNEPDAARNHLAFAMKIALDSNVEGFSERQIVVSAGEVLSPDRNPADAYWMDVVMAAGMKSRRTVGALLFALDAIEQDRLSEEQKKQIAEFRRVLEYPHF